MTVALASSPVIDAVFGLLQDATLQNAIGGRLHDDLPQDAVRPCVWIEVFDESDLGVLGMGNGVQEMDVRIHVFSEVRSFSEARDISGQIKALLKNADLGAMSSGFSQAGRVKYWNTVTLKDQELSGVKVHELVTMCSVWAEQ